MKREIKFRAWDRDVEKFADMCAVHIDGSIMASSQTFGGLYDFVSEEMADRIVLQQYTGLKDRNGVEIYELCELNDRYIVTYKAPSFVLYEISSGDIIDINEHDEYEITTEYKPIPKDTKGGSD